MGSETEFKFHIPGDRITAVEAEVRSEGAEQVKLRAIYFDTPEGALVSKGVVLRLRQEGDRWTQTAKAKGSGPLERLEHNTELGKHPEIPHPDIACYRNTRIGELLDRLPADAIAQLRPTFSTDVTRTRRLVAQGSSKIEMALDVGSVSVWTEAESRGANSPIHELELELIEGQVSDLALLAKDWMRRHRLSLSSVSKAARGERLLAGEFRGAAVKATAMEYPDPRSRLAGDEVQRRVVASCMSQILANATEVASGNVDRDVVHQLRVGIRRLRTALRELEELQPGQFKPEWEAPLKRTFDALGKSRDRELLETKMQPSIEKKGGPRIDLGKKIAGTPLDEAVRDVDFQAALIDLLAFCSPGTPTDAQEAGASAVDPDGTAKVLRKRLTSLHRKVVKGGRAFESLAAEEQHRIRKRLKRLRYMAEFVGPLFRKKGAAKYIRHLTPAQDALGEFNDKHVALATYRGRTAEDPRAWYAVGWLEATQDIDAKACRAAIAEIEGSKKFWKDGS